MIATAHFESKPLLYFNVYLNGFQTSIEVEQHFAVPNLYTMDGGLIFPYPSSVATKELQENPALEKKLRTLLKVKHHQSEEFKGLLEILKAGRSHGKKGAVDKSSKKEGNLLINFESSKPNLGIDEEQIKLNMTTPRGIQPTMVIQSN